MSNETTTDAFNPRVILGPNDGKPRLLHAMFPVTDLDASVRFYVEGLGMKVLYRAAANDVSRAEAVFVGYDTAEAGAALIELARYLDHEGPYSHGTGAGHICIGVADVPAMVAKLVGLGGQVVAKPLSRPPSTLQFVADPDGHQIELTKSLRN